MDRGCGWITADTWLLWGCRVTKSLQRVKRTAAIHIRKRVQWEQNRSEHPLKVPVFQIYCHLMEANRVAANVRFAM